MLLGIFRLTGQEKAEENIVIVEGHYDSDNAGNNMLKVAHKIIEKFGLSNQLSDMR